MDIGSVCFMKNSYNTNPAQPALWQQACKYLWDLLTFSQYHVTYHSVKQEKQLGNHERKESAKLDYTLSPQFKKVNHSFPSVNYATIPDLLT